MTADLDLDALTKVAKAATPCEWFTEREKGTIIIAAVAPRQGVYADPKGGTSPEADRTHIATFDPPTVLALIAELRTARAAAQQGTEITEAAVERVARAICIASGEAPDATWRWADNEGTRVPFWKKYVPHARAAITAALNPNGDAR